MTSKDFLLDLYKTSPNTKNILFKNSITLDDLEEIVNKSSVYKIIPIQLKKVDFELIIFEAIKLNALERRLKEYQRVLEDAVDKRTKELNNINVKLNILATMDSLCGVKNRRSFFESCGPIISYNRREKKQLSVLMIDIDKFKFINDNYGHAIGDEILKLMAQKSNYILRNSDVFARLGGEEFAAVLPGTSQRGAMKVAENIKILSDKDNERSTFEICIYQDNKDICDELFSEGRKTLTVLDFMLKNKAEAAFDLLEKYGNELVVPEYIKEAIQWIKN